MAKEFKYRGKTLEELKKMGLSELADLFPARPRRTLRRGLTDDQKKLVAKVEAGKKKLRTHCRDMVIIPALVGHTIQIHNGKDWIGVEITLEKVGHYLGEFAQTRRLVRHSGPGVGATRGSKHQSVK